MARRVRIIQDDLYGGRSSWTTEEYHDDKGDVCSVQLSSLCSSKHTDSGYSNAFSDADVSSFPRTSLGYRAYRHIKVASYSPAYSPARKHQPAQSYTPFRALSTPVQPLQREQSSLSLEPFSYSTRSFSTAQMSPKSQPYNQPASRPVPHQYHAPAQPLAPTQGYPRPLSHVNQQYLPARPYQQPSPARSSSQTYTPIQPPCWTYRSPRPIIIVVEPETRPQNTVTIQLTRSAISKLEEVQRIQLLERHHARRNLKRALRNWEPQHRTVVKAINFFGFKNASYGENEISWVNDHSSGEIRFVGSLGKVYRRDKHIGPEVGKYDDACRALRANQDKLDDLRALEKMFVMRGSVNRQMIY